MFKIVSQSGPNFFSRNFFCFFGPEWYRMGFLNVPAPTFSPPPPSKKSWAGLTTFRALYASIFGKKVLPCYSSKKNKEIESNNNSLCLNFIFLFRLKNLEKNNRHK